MRFKGGFRFDVKQGASNEIWGGHRQDLIKKVSDSSENFPFTTTYVFKLINTKEQTMNYLCYAAITLLRFWVSI